MNCILCKNQQVKNYHQDKKRRYLVCESCGLIFVDPKDYINTEREKARYDQHQNLEENKGYLNFLSPVIELIKKEVEPGNMGLDFGSGPNPVLAKKLEEMGYEMSIFDIYYANNEDVFKKTYDFIVSTEVIEHLSKPGEELEKLWKRLRAKGDLFLMTQLTDGVDFEKWHYKNDPTHITFFNRKSLHKLAIGWEAEISFLSDNLIHLKKV